MLDGLLGKTFSAKCKPLIKMTKNRVEVIKRKRKATEKFLKKDIADLLHSGLDINAYGRAEGLLVELILSSCYGFVEKSYELVLKHLSVMQKLSGCPAECRVAVSSLMFAAARFSDLPELRDLRQIFQERYGSSVECFVNQEFAANLNSKSSTLEKKVCLMQEIASEFSINWDSKAFEIRMSRPSAFAQGQSASICNNLFDYDKSSVSKDFCQKDAKNDVMLENGKEAVILKDLNRDYHELQYKSTFPGNGFKPLNGREVLGKKDGHDNSLTGKQEVTTTKSDRSYWKEGNMLKPIGRSFQDKTLEKFEDGFKLHDSLGNMTPPRKSQDTATSTRIGSRFRSNVKEPCAGPPDTDKSERKVQHDETPMLKPCFSNVIPPPYVKHVSKHQNRTRGVNVVSPHTDSDGFFTCPSVHENSDAASMSERTQIGLNKSDLDWQASRHERLSKQSPKKELYFREDSKEIPKLKAKSTRRKHSRSRTSHYDAPNVDTELVRKARSRSRRRSESRRGLRNLFVDEQHQNAEEERVIDKLLIHYSKKPSILKPEIVRKKSNSHHEHKMDNSTRELLQNGDGDGDGSDETPEIVTLPLRSVSLPREQTRVIEAKKDFVRAASFQPDRSYETRHVHPKLPDCDDLATRLAALKGR